MSVLKQHVLIMILQGLNEQKIGPSYICCAFQSGLCIQQ